jgi:dolichol-phosphate mannosyltransferase
MIRLQRFALVGASGLVINLATFSMLHGAGVGRLVAAAAAFAAAVVNNFWWNRSWTFAARHAGRSGGQAVRFLAVSSAGFGLTVCLLMLATAAGAPALPAEALATVAVTPVAFLANRRWTFARRAPDRIQEATR